MDVFGDDIDSILGNDDLNQNIGSGAENENDGNNSDAKDEGTSKTVDPKRRTIRKPQFRLNVERLIDRDRGVHTLEKYYQGIKYRGKGFETEDLDNVLKRMEHWAHRLYPKFNFKDFLATTEQVGKKKQLQTHMNRYRQGMLELNNKPVAEDEPEEMEIVDQPFDDIDELLGQQIEKYKTAPSASKLNNTTFDSMRSSVISTPRFMGRQPVEASTPMSPIGCRPLDETPVPDTPQPQLTSEQRAMIAENRRIALERLKARREAAAVVENVTATVSLSTNDNDESM